MSVRRAWEVRENDTATTWCDVRLSFDDGAGVELLAVVCEGCVSIEDVRARPALSLDDLAVLADWIEGPLLEACAGTAEAQVAGADDGSSGRRHARPALPRGTESRRLVAGEYLAAQRAGRDPVLAVMSATGHSRRRSLRLIAGARDAGLLAPRHARP
ncbi:hypothetical protein QF026_007656 [Streptomyces aurantiacus]|uniref:DUF6214 family protein n=1 Tax=Streptomyces aurantiacus TaxID=47760 RepID=UPI00278F57AE|nr:DUF6214 family protein [Streptomyces aurantiacus]MDQ0779190.1 hypothetical protein [Streptomyces aurantiacus]